jgi:hypothetical protein
MRKVLLTPIAILPPPLAGEDRPHPVLKHTKARTWVGFERRAKAWSITKDAGAYTIHAFRKTPGEGYLGDRSRSVRLPKGTSARAAVRKLLEIHEAEMDYRPPKGTWDED